MSKQSRARAATRATAAATAKAKGHAAPSDGPNAFLARWGILLAGSMVVLAALAAYGNSFSGPFLLDDHLAIIGNPSIRQLGSALSPPNNSTTLGRPLLNLTFALNYATGGMNVWGYHAFNLLVHALAGLVLFGVVRRTLLGSRCELRRAGPAIAQSEHSECGRGALTPPTVLALAIAVLWTVHPLQTEVVTYISQRAESLMGLFYLLTLYCFIRGVESASPETGVRNQESGDRSRKPEVGNQQKQSEFRPLSFRLSPAASNLWFLASVFSCLLGTLSKEIIVTAPVMVLLYDRTFVAGSFREACRLRWRYYLGLAATWLLLAHQMHGLGLQSVGFDQGVTWWSYALTSCRSVVLYCKMALWPHPLVFDYGAHFIQRASEAAPYALVLATLFAVVMVAWRYQPAVGFAGAWFFLILAPTSSVVPVALQPTADHRLYLSLAAVVALGVLGLYRLIGPRALVACAAVAVGLGWLSVQRNEDYRSALAIWSDTVAKCPDNVRARYNLGNALLDLPGRSTDAIAQFEAAVRIKPDEAQTYYNLGNAYHTVGQIPEAIAQYEEALRLKPDYAEVHNNLGSALLIKFPGRLPEAMGHFETALQIKPDYPEAHYNFGIALSNAGRISEAIAQYKEAVRLSPDYAEAHAALDQLQRAAR